MLSLFKKSFLIGIAVLSLAACNQAEQSGTPSDAVSSDIIIATLNGTNITEADIADLMAAQLRQVKVDLYQAHKQGAEAVINDRLLTEAIEKSGLTREEYLKQQLRDKADVSDKEIKAFYEQRKDRFQDKKIEEVAPSIKQFLSQQKGQQAVGQLLAELRKNADVSWHIEAPRVEVTEGDHPSQGPADAKIVIVEFSDYQCPFCGRARSTVQQILDEYSGRVRYVFRDFPLSFHKDAQKAHEAAHCANEQQKYWEYNKKLFASQKDLKEADLKKYAKELKLDQKKFDECLSSGKYAQMVQQSLQYGQSVGVSGTPAFFINGRMISGARPFASFKEIIDDELSQVN